MNAKFCQCSKGLLRLSQKKLGVNRVIVDDETWGSIPLLHVYSNDLTENSPVVIFLHGFQSAKEHNLHYAYQLVRRGMRVILPDAYLHGDRDEGLNEVEMSLHFWEVIFTSIKEVEFLYEQLQQKGLLKSGRIGLLGSSMGAITTFGALKQYDWIDAISACMGAPGYVEFGEYLLGQVASLGLEWPVPEKQVNALRQMLIMYDITKTPETFAGRPVFFWHGMKDTTVPFEPTYRFYEQLCDAYEAYPERLKFVEDSHAAHKVTREGIIQATSWLAQHLA